MPLPFIIAGIAALTSAAGAAAATAVAVASTAITIGGVSVTVGALATGAIGAAVTFGISKALLEDVDSYTSETITEAQKDYEKNRLKDKLEDEKNDLRKKYGITDFSQVDTMANNDEYLKALSFIGQLKLKLAEDRKNEELAKESEKILLLLKQVREESKKL